LFTAFESERSQGAFICNQGVVAKFLTFLGGKASGNLAALKADAAERHRDLLQKTVAPATVNTHSKVFRVALEKAVKQGIFDPKPARFARSQDDLRQLQSRFCQ